MLTQKKFPSAIDRVVSMSIGVILLFITVLFLMQLIWVIAGGMLLLDLFVAYTFFTTAYEITPDTLRIKCGFYSKAISISSIRKMTRIKSIVNAPANSFTRLEIFYNSYDSIMISPKRETEFVKQLLEYNPGIEIELPYAV